MNFSAKTIILSFTLAVYIVVLWFSKFSLTGFWTDIVAILILLSAIINLFFNMKIYKVVSVVLLVSLTASVIVLLSNPFILKIAKTRSLYFINVYEEFYNVYFMPSGAESGGEGSLFISKSPRYFPIIEQAVYYNDAVLYDFSSDEFDGNPVNAREVAKEYIEEHLSSSH